MITIEGINQLWDDFHERNGCPPRRIVTGVAGIECMASAVQHDAHFSRARMEFPREFRGVKIERVKNPTYFALENGGCIEVFTDMKDDIKLKKIREIIESVTELGSEFTDDEARACDDALTQIYEVLDTVDAEEDSGGNYHNKHHLDNRDYSIGHRVVMDNPYFMTHASHTHPVSKMKGIFNLDST